MSTRVAPDRPDGGDGFAFIRVVSVEDKTFAAMKVFLPLGIRPGTEVLSMRRVSWDREGTPVERSETLARNDRAVLEIKHRCARDAGIGGHRANWNKQGDG